MIQTFRDHSITDANFFPIELQKCLLCAFDLMDSQTLYAAGATCKAWHEMSIEVICLRLGVDKNEWNSNHYRPKLWSLYRVAGEVFREMGWRLPLENRTHVIAQQIVASDIADKVAPLKIAARENQLWWIIEHYVTELKIDAEEIEGLQKILESHSVDEISHGIILSDKVYNCAGLIFFQAVLSRNGLESLRLLKSGEAGKRILDYIIGLEQVPGQIHFFDLLLTCYGDRTFGGLSDLIAHFEDQLQLDRSQMHALIKRIIHARTDMHHRRFFTDFLKRSSTREILDICWSTYQKRALASVRWTIIDLNIRPDMIFDLGQMEKMVPANQKAIFSEFVRETKNRIDDRLSWESKRSSEQKVKAVAFFIALIGTLAIFSLGQLFLLRSPLWRIIKVPIVVYSLWPELLAFQVIVMYLAPNRVIDYINSLGK